MRLVAVVLDEVAAVAVTMAMIEAASLEERGVTAAEAVVIARWHGLS